MREICFIFAFMCNKRIKMSNFYLIVLRQKSDRMVHFQTFITHKHKYKTNFTHFVFIGHKVSVQIFSNKNKLKKFRKIFF